MRPSTADRIQLTPNLQFYFYPIRVDETAARIEQSYRAAKVISDRVYILSNNPLIQGDGVMRVPHQVDEMIYPALYAGLCADDGVYRL